MNTPEKITQVYLRLNGFFTIPQFTTLKEKGGHIDFLAVRLAGSLERVGVAPNQTILQIDEDLLLKLGVTKDEMIGLIIEVKGGKVTSAKVDKAQFDYAKTFFGNLDNIKRVGFERRRNLKIFTRNDHIIITLKYCMNFIKKRFLELKTIEQDLRGSRLLSKEGSWELSDEFLSELIYLENL